MNGVNLAASVIARVVARRGTAHPFARLDPGRTALVVVDMQNGFMDDAIGHAVCPAARDIVPNVNRLAATVRKAGGGVFWIQNTFDATSEREWSVLQEMATPEGRRRRAASMSEGTPGHRLWPGLDVLPQDEVVRKYRSAPSCREPATWRTGYGRVGSTRCGSPGR